MKKGTKAVKLKADLFQRICQQSSFYGSSLKYHQAMLRYERLLEAPSMSPDQKLEIGLALIRIKRMRFVLDYRSASRLLDEIRERVRCNPLLELKYRIVRAEVILYKKADFRTARLEFQSLADTLCTSEHHFLYALVASGLAISLMMSGDETSADEYYQDCISLFRRIGNQIQYAYSLMNYGILKKRICQYSDAERLSKKALDTLSRAKVVEGQPLVHNLLAIIKMKTGDWRAAEYYLEKAMEILDQSSAIIAFDRKVNADQETNLLHLEVLRRDFAAALALSENFSKRVGHDYSEKQKALNHEFVGELHIESGELSHAQAHLDAAMEITLRIAPESDVMTEIKRRQAQLYLLEGRVDRARSEALECINLCKKISDKHEMGAALRILGEVYVRLELTRKATSTFDAAFHTLKTIGECYELMRTCIAYADFLIKENNPEADIYLLEAKQLCKKLEIDFFMSQIMLLSSKYAVNCGDYLAARSYLKKAEELCDGLQDCDRKKLKPAIRAFYRTLERVILQASMESAEQLKSLGRIYEGARFPIEELKPELALEVAQNVGAESLFLVKRKNTGFKIPIRYNIQVNKAKDILRRLLKTHAKEFFTSRDPQVRPLSDGRTLVCVPGQGGTGYVLCTVMPEEKHFTPRELEFLFASVEAMERVAEDYAEDPKCLDVSDFLEEREGRLLHPGGSFKQIITIDPEMIKIIHLAERVSQTDVPILLEGETGVGKELFARAIHANSPRSSKELVAINAGGVPVNFLESQLFGHIRGAFTDAVADRIGLIEEARGGTLFLDEVGEMSEELQVKLLRLLEDGEYRRLGENKIRYADVRVICATNKDLQGEVSRGLFREDLFYRVATVRFKIPELRARNRDIEFLVRHFLSEGLARIGRPNRRVHVDVKALEAFEIYSWPGNVRELRNEILRVLSLIGEGDVIRFGMLSDRIKNYLQSRSDGGLLGKSVDRYERRLILKALEENDWNRIKTAQQIGIPRTTLLAKMKRLNITA